MTSFKGADVSANKHRCIFDPLQLQAFYFNFIFLPSLYQPISTKHIQVCILSQGPYSHILITGGPSDFLGSEILAQSDFFGVAKKKTEGYFWVAKKGLRDFYGYAKKVVIFLGRQILKL